MVDKKKFAENSPKNIWRHKNFAEFGRPQISSNWMIFGFQATKISYFQNSAKFKIHNVFLKIWWGAVVQWAYSSCISLLQRQGSADRIPVVPLSFIRERERTSSKLERRNAMQGTGGPSREKKGGSGESKKKNRQAFREWLRERRKKVRRKGEVT